MVVQTTNRVDELLVCYRANRTFGALQTVETQDLAHSLSGHADLIGDFAIGSNPAGVAQYSVCALAALPQ